MVTNRQVPQQQCSHTPGGRSRPQAGSEQRLERFGDKAMQYKTDVFLRQVTQHTSGIIHKDDSSAVSIVEMRLLHWVHFSIEAP